MAALVVVTLGTCAIMFHVAWKMVHTAAVAHAVLVDLSTKVQKVADELWRFGTPMSQTEDARKKRMGRLKTWTMYRSTRGPPSSALGDVTVLWVQ